MGSRGQGPYGLCPNGPPGLLWALPLSARPSWAPLGPYGPGPYGLGPYGLGPYGAPWSLWAGPLCGGPLWASQALVGRALMGFPGHLWARPLWDGPLWASLGPSGPGPHGPGPYGLPWALMGRALMGQVLLGLPAALMGWALTDRALMGLPGHWAFMAPGRLCKYIEYGAYIYILCLVLPPPSYVFSPILYMYISIRGLRKASLVERWKGCAVAPANSSLWRLPCISGKLFLSPCSLPLYSYPCIMYIFIYIYGSFYFVLLKGN